ncbi:MAG: ferredoxin [Nanoarchaeota archaeon]|nr:ferredoxin [Nanoarchaeota archaeon]|tara:strand:+ start:901 stop:1161 length:261 start_codon:yes stop_codon:yes gene_type:complete
MAKVEVDGKSLEVKDGEHIKDAIEELGVIIACADGTCGVCRVKIEEGMENLNEINEAEKGMECEEGERLGCQCKILKGEVKVKPVF